MADFLTDTRAEIERRLEELRPLQEEYDRLERAKAALDGIDGQSAPSGRAPRPRSGGTSGRTATGGGRRASPPGNGRRRQRQRAGGRSGETLELVRRNPGITVAEIADRLGMKQRNYLYRIMADLQSQGAVEKEGRGFFAR